MCIRDSILTDEDRQHGDHDYRRDKMGGAADPLHQIFERRAAHFVDKQRKNDGKREADHDLQQTENDGIFKDDREIRIRQKFAEVLQPDPGAVSYTHLDVYKRQLP